MLAEVTLDLVASFLPDAKSMASFARASRHSGCTVYANIPAAIKAVESKMTKYQRQTLCNLPEKPGIGHFKALVEQKCIVCKSSYRGGIRGPWGIPAHPGCTKGLEVNLRYVKGGIPEELLPLIRSTIPVNIREGYSSYSHCQYTYETVILKPIPGVIPRQMTLEYFFEAHADEVSSFLNRVRAEEEAKQQKRKREAGEKRAARQTKQKMVNHDRRTSIERLAGTTYLRWMRGVPKCAKKLVAKLSAEDSLVAVSLVAANADLSEETHKILLELNYKRPCVTELRCAYKFVQDLGEDGISLLRCNGSVARARADITRRSVAAESGTAD